MSRSVKKGPYVEERLLNRVKAQMNTTDKKVIKTIGGIVIGIIIIVVMPIIDVVSVFNGIMYIDTDNFNQSIQENISAEPCNH